MELYEQDLNLVKIKVIQYEVESYNKILNLILNLSFKLQFLLYDSDP